MSKIAAADPGSHHARTPAVRAARSQPTPGPAAMPLVETDPESGSVATVLRLAMGGHHQSQAAEIGLSLRSTATVLALQRAIGNHALQQVLCRANRPLPQVSQAHQTSPAGKLQRETQVDRKAPSGVVQRAPKTDKERFMAKSFTLKAFVPTTALGNFDVEYKPKTGAMRVIMNLHFDFTDVDAAWKSQATDPADTKWKSTQKKQWVNEFKTQILSVWGNINQIKCVKPGWEDIVASPKLEIKEVSKSKANFSVTVDKAFTTAAGKMRTSQGSTSVGGEGREKKAAFQEQDNKDKINDPRVKNHLANTERTLNITPAFTRDQERLAKVLAQFLGVVFRPGTAELSASMTTTLKSAAARVVALRKDSALARLHPIKVKLGLKGSETAALAGQRFTAIQALLTGAGVENPLVSEAAASANPRATFAPGDAGGVSDAYFANWKRLTVAHEFGHMMGLLDEYCPAVSPDLLQMMEDEGAIPDAGAAMSGTAQGRVAQDKDKQDAYAKLLKANNMKTPTWARPTTDSQEKSTSLMSGGFEILTQHYVTIWEALAKATEADLTKSDWKLEG